MIEVTRSPSDHTNSPTCISFSPTVFLFLRVSFPSMILCMLTRGKVPFLPSPPPEADRIKPSCVDCVCHSDQRTWEVHCDRASLVCGISSSKCDLSELFHPQRALGSSFMLLLMHDNQIPRSYGRYLQRTFLKSRPLASLENERPKKKHRALSSPK